MQIERLSQLGKIAKKQFQNVEFRPQNLADSEDAYKMGDYFKADDFVVTDDGDIFVRHDPLLRVAKQLMTVEGRNVQLIGCPEKRNEWQASAIVTYKFAEDFTFADAADCRTSTSNGFDHYTTAMAVTRASARALRFALGIPYCSSEEIADINNMIDDTVNDAIDDGQLGVLKKKYFGQYGFNMDDVNEFLSREIFELEELFRGEAADLMQALNRKKKPIDIKLNIKSKVKK